MLARRFSLIDLAAMFYSMKTQWLKIFCITFVVCCCAVFYLAHNKGNKFLLTFELPYTVDATGKNNATYSQR